MLYLSNEKFYFMYIATVVLTVLIVYIFYKDKQTLREAKEGQEIYLITSKHPILMMYIATFLGIFIAVILTELDISPF